MKANIKLIVSSFFGALLVSLLAGGQACQAAAVIVDHNCTDIHRVPTNWVVQAKQQLHIAYGHTSHGSQLITGMNGLVAFMNSLGYPTNLYAFNSGGSGGALDLRDTPFSGASDLGAPDWTSWATATRTYLNSNTNCNVVIWSWCGQVSGASEANINTYLTLMDGLRQDYTNVTFVHMTGHLDGGGTNGNLNIRNNQIRDYCLAHDGILYDFADIESYNPDRLTNYMALLANDNCDYDSDGNGSQDSNWATAWESSHAENVDWYSCSPAHTQALNGNRKAYAAWWLWARLAGWQGTNYFEVWQEKKFTVQERSNPALEATVWGRWADPDADGLANIFEYALGKSPRNIESAEPLIRDFGFDAGGHLKLAWLRAPNTPEVSFNLQHSENLGSWSDVSPQAATNTVQTLTNGLERVELQFLDVPAGSAAFYRLRLSAE